MTSIKQSTSILVLLMMVGVLRAADENIEIYALSASKDAHHDASFIQASLEKQGLPSEILACVSTFSDQNPYAAPKEYFLNNVFTGESTPLEGNPLKARLWDSNDIRVRCLSFIDGDGREKPLYYRRPQSVVTLRPKDRSCSWRIFVPWNTRITPFVAYKAEKSCPMGKCVHKEHLKKKECQPDECIVVITYDRFQPMLDKLLAGPPELQTF